MLVNRLTLDLRAFTTQETILSFSTYPAEFASESSTADKDAPALQSIVSPQLAMVTTPSVDEDPSATGCVTNSRCGVHTSTSEYVELQYLSLGRSSYKQKL